MKRILRTLPLVVLLAAFGFCQGAPTPVFQYRLDDGQGTVAADSASPGQPAQLLGPGSFWSADTPSGKGYSYRIDSRRSSSLSAPAEGRLENLEDFTVTWWMKLSRAEARTDRIFSTRASHNAGEGYLDLLVASDNPAQMQLELVLSNGNRSGRSEVSSEVFDATQWVFVALVRKQKEGEVLYFVGPANAAASLRAAGGGKANKAGNINNGPSKEIRLGGYPGDSKNHSPDGLFQDWRFYREALSPEQLEHIFRAGLSAE